MIDREQKWGRFRANLVAMDIVGFSEWRNYQGALFEHRTNLKRAIEQTNLFHNTTDNLQRIAHFLGDEFRLAFDSASVSLDDVLRFLQEVHRELANNRSWPTYIRAAIVTGDVEQRNLSGCTYLFGPAVFEVERLVRHAGPGETALQRKVYGSVVRKGIHIVIRVTKSILGVKKTTTYAS
jgi:class 3 adenylate cyclase